MSPLMTVQGFVEAIVSFVRDHEAWALPIVFLVAFGESFAFLSVLWPGTAILVGITALLAASGITHTIVWPMIVAATLGGTAGYAVSYWIGRYFETSIPRLWPFTAYPDMIPRGERFFREYGTWGVFFGHFFGPVRAVIPVVAGMFRMPQLPFQIANAASAFLWAAGVIAPSFFAVTFKNEILQLTRDYALVGLALLGALGCLNALPIRSTAVVTLIGFLVVAVVLALAGVALVLALPAGAIGAFVGDVFAYRNGARHRADFHALWPNGWGRSAAEAANAAFVRDGVLTLIYSKFHTTLRSYAPMAAGARELPLATFLAVSLLSSALWAGVLMGPMWLLRHLLGW